MRSSYAVSSAPAQPRDRTTVKQFTLWMTSDYSKVMRNGYQLFDPISMLGCENRGAPIRAPEGVRVMFNFTRSTNRSVEYRRNKTSSELRISTKTVTKVNVKTKPLQRSRPRALTSVLVLVLRMVLVIAKELIGSGERLKIETFTGTLLYADK